MKITGTYTDCDIFAKTLEDGIYSQIYDIINSKAFKDKKVCVMPDGHVGASGPCGLVAQIGNYVCPEHVGVDVGCEISAMFLNSKVKEEDYKLLPISYIAKNYFGKSSSWLYQRINGTNVRGRTYTLNGEQKKVFNSALKEIGEKIASLSID